MTNIKLDVSKLLGFKIVASEVGADQRGSVEAKLGEKEALGNTGMELKIGAKIGSKVGGKIGLKLS